MQEPHVSFAEKKRIFFAKYPGALQPGDTLAVQRAAYMHLCAHCLSQQLLCIYIYMQNMCVLHHVRAKTGSGISEASTVAASQLEVASYLVCTLGGLCISALACV